MTEKQSKHIPLLMILVLGLSIILEIVNIIGYMCPYQIPNRKGIAGYDYRIISPSQAKVRLKKYNNESISHYVQRANSIIFYSLVHTDKLKFTIFDNWLLYAGSFFYSPLVQPRLSSMILIHGGGICSQACIVLSNYLKKYRIPYSFVGLNGHVVLEVFVNNKQIVADPDYGVVYNTPLKILESYKRAEMINKSLTKKGYSIKQIKYVIDKFTTRYDNKVVPTNEPFSPRLFMVAELFQWLKWIIPLIVIFIVSIYIYRRNNVR